VIVFPDATIGEDITDWGAVRNKLLFRTVVHGKMVDDYATPGSLFNAVIQGLGASLMRDAVARLRDHGYDVVLRCHDELVVEVDKDSDFARFKSIFLTTPAWAPDLAINGEGWVAERYRKG
jgi:DNA polymerase